MENKEFKYENDIFTSKKGNATTKTTLSLEEHLVPRSMDKDSQMLIHEDFSRFVVNILENNEGQKSSVKANIPVDEVPYILSKIKNAVTVADYLRMTGAYPSDDNTNNNGGSSNNSEPKIFSLKEFSGKTPTEILLENGANRQKLVDHIKILKDNLQKYPANQKTIDAINSAVAKFDKGELNGVAPTKKIGELKCYISEMKYFREQKDGYNKCYQVAIEYDANMKIPFVIKICNCWCKLSIKEGGQTIIQMSTKKDMIIKSYRLSEIEMEALANELKLSLNDFHNLYYGEKKALTDARVKAKRDKYSNSQS